MSEPLMNVSKREVNIERGSESLGTSRFDAKRDKQEANPQVLE
ncbi:hypothetical protein [Wolbachia endosymbiont (group A) of Beris morrisii]